MNTGFDDYIGKYYGFWQRLLPADATPAIFRPLGPAAQAIDPVGIFRGERRLTCKDARAALRRRAGKDHDEVRSERVDRRLG